MNAFGRVSRYLFLVSSIFLITGIFGYLYYSETVSKETYFNQLAFRKLGEVSRGLETNLKRLKNYTSQTRTDLIDLQKELAADANKPDDLDSGDFEYAQEELLYELAEVTWAGAQEEVKEIAEEFAEVVGLQGEVTTLAFTCERQPQWAYLEHKSYTAKATEYCVALSYYYDLVVSMRLVAGQTKNQLATTANIDRMKTLLTKMEEGEELNYGYLDELDRSEEILELLMEKGSFPQQQFSPLFYDFMLGYMAEELESTHDNFRFFVKSAKESRRERGDRRLEDFLKDIDKSSAAHDLKPRFIREKTCPLESYVESCDKLLFIADADKASLYPGSNVTVTSYLQGGGKFEASLGNFLPRDLDEFSTLVIAASNGDVLLQTNSSSDVVSHRFLNISQFLSDAIERQKAKKSEADQGADSATSLRRTAYVSEEIGGIQHRVYIYPHEIRQFDLHIGKNPKKEPLIYVIGVKPLSSITNEKLSISSGTSVLLLSAAMAILLAFVFLKIQLAHIDASFTRLEGAVAVGSVVIFVVIAMIGSFSLALSHQIDSNVREDAESSLGMLKQRFAIEIESHLLQIDALLASDRNVVATLSGSSKPTVKAADGTPATTKTKRAKACLAGPKKDEIYLIKNLPPNLGSKRSSPLENLFMLNADGSLPGPLVRGTQHLARAFKGNLSGRKYFQHALANDVWEIEVKQPGNHHYWLCNAVGDNVEDGAAQEPRWFPVYLERIFNLGDGTLNTQLSMPILHEFADGSQYDAVTRYEIGNSDVRVISAGLTLRTFQAPIMPPGQSFAVVENATGQVLFHSDESRSLVENFFQETENDIRLRAIIRTAPSMNKHSSGQVSSFTGQYRGKSTEFFVDKLHPAIPWSLVIFQDASEGQGVVSVIFSVVMLITISIILLLALLLSVGGLLDLQVTNWLWPQIGKLHIYPAAALLALVGIVPYYWLLKLPLGSFGMIATIVTVSLLILWGFRQYILHSESVSPEDPGNASPPEALQHRYLFFVMSLLMLLTFAPVAQVVNKVSYEALQRVIAYDAVQLAEAGEVAKAAISKRINRLCGSGAYLRSSFENCDSIFPSALDLDIQKIEKSQNLGRAFLVQELLQPTSLMVTRPCDGDRIYCGESMESSARPAGNIAPVELRITDFPLELLSQSRWELPVLLNAASPDVTAEQPISKLDATRIYLHQQNYSSVFRLLKYSPISLGLLFVALLITAGAIHFLATNLLGIGLPRSYRAGYLRLNNQNWDEFASGNNLCNEFEKDYKDLRQQLVSGNRKFAILIRPSQARLDELLASMEDDAIHLARDRAPLDSHSLAASEAKRKLLAKHLKETTHERQVLVLESLESVAFDTDKRRAILDLLEGVTNSGDNVSVLLVCDVAPLYMLTHQDRYVPNTMSDAFADAQESMRWSRLLSQFDKYYGWSPMDLDFVETGQGAHLKNTLLRECSSWPELYYLKDELDLLQQQHKDLLEEQAIQYISTHAGPIYRRRWSFCTKEEKLLLYQLAKGQMINPMNREPLEHMMRRGFIRRDPKWSIVSESFSRFVLTAEDEQIYLKWMKASEQGLWKILRVPLFTIALMILGILMYSAQETMESMLALAASALAFLPLLLRSFSIVGGPKAPPPTN